MPEIICDTMECDTRNLLASAVTVRARCSSAVRMLISSAENTLHRGVAFFSQSCIIYNQVTDVTESLSRDLHTSVMLSTRKMKNFHNTNSAICQNIRRLTAAKGWTRTKLAKESGVSYRLVHEIMHNNASLRDDTIGKIAAALDVSLDDLNKEEGAPSTGGEYPSNPSNPSTPMMFRDTGHQVENGQTLMDAIRTIARQLHRAEDDVFKAILEFTKETGE